MRSVGRDQQIQILRVSKHKYCAQVAGFRMMNPGVEGTSV